MRTQAQIDYQIKGIQKEMSELPAYSMFGTPNHEIATAKMNILSGDLELENVDEGDWENSDNQNEIYRGAEEATEWLEERNDDNLFEE